MRVRPERNSLIQTSGRDHEQFPVHLCTWQSRTTTRTETSDVVCGRQGKRLDTPFPTTPPQPGGSGKKVGRVGRTGILATELAMTEVEAIKMTHYFESNLSAQAGALVPGFHLFSALTIALKSSLPETSLYHRHPAVHAFDTETAGTPFLPWIPRGKMAGG